MKSTTTTTTITKTKIKHLARFFRNDPLNPALLQRDVWATFEAIGGEAAVLYGAYWGQPGHYFERQRQLAKRIREALEKYAAR